MDIKEYNEKFNEKRISENIADMPSEARDIAMQAFKAENANDLYKAKDLAKKAIEVAGGENTEPVRILLARIYPKILVNDIEEATKNYKTDVAEYIEFLDSINMNDIMQQYLVDTLIRLCALLENDWYRPLFKEFVDIINEKNYLTESDYENTIKSAYASLESLEYFSDTKVSYIVRGFLKISYEKLYSMEEDNDTQNEGDLINELTNKWFICKALDDKKEEFEHIMNNYPHSYNMISDTIDEMQSNKENYSDNLVDELLKYAREGTTKDDLIRILNNSYEKINNPVNKKVVVHTGRGVYTRSATKVGRNEPCPCGSGKKYKNCCGK